MGEAFITRGGTGESGGGLPVPVGTPLEGCTWEQISQIAKAGLAEQYFTVGDKKAIFVDGTVGTINISALYYVYIIGFGHNNAINTIDFGAFKIIESLSLIDANYRTYVSNGTKTFNLSHWGSGNYGGWKGCDTRYDVLGSTNVQPSGYGSAVSSGRTGYDATDTCATSPVSNTLMAALPAELRAVMRPMTIYSDNTGGGSDTASYVTASVDYLPLLAEYEIFGARSRANSAEQNYQAQYAYYSVGNSTKKYSFLDDTTAVQYWQRSARVDNTTGFCMVNNTGSVDVGTANYVYTLAPIFRV